MTKFVGNYIFKQIRFHLFAYIYLVLSSSCHAPSIDIPDHRFRQVFRATPHILTELLYVGLSWSPCFFAWLSFMSSSLPLQQCSACLVHLIWIVFVMGGRWPYSCCTGPVQYCLQHSCVVAIKPFLQLFS